MPLDETSALQQAKTLVETGEPEQAGVILAELVRRYPNDLEAWTWLARCVRTDRQKGWCEEQINRIKRGQAGIQHGALTRRHPSSRLPTNRRAGLRRLSLAVLGGVLFITLALLGYTWIPTQMRLDEVLPGETQELPAPAAQAAALPALDNSLLLQPFFPVESVRNEPVAFLPSLFSADATEIAAPVETAAEPSDDPRPNPKKWKNYPVVPFVSQNAIKIWEKGIKEGNDPHAFSVLGDCHSAPNVLFGRFADIAYRDNPDYRPYHKTLKFFQVSWDRSFITVANGMSVASALNPLWARDPACKPGETPLLCELRVHKPGILIISLGTNWGGRSPDEFEGYLRQIVELTLQAHVLPMIATKGDPAGPNNPLNERMVKVAYDYDIPLWNFWAAIQDLPDQGLKPWDRGGMYLSEAAWAVKRDTGLMALDAIRKRLSGEQ